MTRGIENVEEYYYTRLYTDAARAVTTAANLPGADPARVGVFGISQGGGLSLAAAALRPDVVQVCAADVPFLCDLRRAVTLVDSNPYHEVAEFLANHADLVDVALGTLDHVDNALLATRIRAETYVSVGLMDEICPPSTVFAAYNAWGGGTKKIDVYPYNNHEGGQAYRFPQELAWLRTHMS
jgi:cephalosporin-C deacetylase